MTFLIKGSYNQNKPVPSYKFYSKIIGELLRARKNFGCEIEGVLVELRKYLRLDLKEARKIKDSFYGGTYQYVFLCIFLYVFVFLLKKIVNIELDYLKLIFILIYHSFGLLIYFFACKLIQRAEFKYFDSYFNTVYLLRSLLLVSRPISEVIDRIKVSKLAINNNFININDRLITLLRQLKHSGKLNLLDLDNLILEVWDTFEIKVESYERKITVLKLLLMSFFILPSFLFIIFCMISAMNL